MSIKVVSNTAQYSSYNLAMVYSYTMTSTIVITVIVLASVLLHIVQAHDQGDQQPTAATTQTVINNCCDLGFRQSTFSEIINNPKQYKMKNMCGKLSTITNVYCDTVTAGGGWLVIQRRINGSVDFNRYWSEYEEGFGNLPVDGEDTTGEFWIGLRSLHCLTSQGQWELRIDYMFPNKTKGYLSYRHFRVGPASDDYRLSISGYSGNTTDPITPVEGHNLNSMRFTTRDRDNDKRDDGNCALKFLGGKAGGWWYNDCSYLVPNHQYNNNYTAHLNGQWYSLPFIEIKIRPLNCNP